MKKLNNIIPLIDYLYIFQLFEYEKMDFLKWFLKNPFKRNLQKKHTLDLTPKAILLLLGCLSLMFILALGISFVLTGYILNIPSLVIALVIFSVFSQISPIFYLLAQLLLTPIENYRKQKIINAAKEKISSLKHIKVVAIVGSYAKTSTKNMLYTLLWKDFLVVKTPKSFNTEISIARTILRDLKENTEVFIVEMDAYHPGEIKKLGDLVKPDLAIITSIAPQHLERFGSMQKLATTQFEIAKTLKKDGILFLNSTDEWSKNLAPQINVNKVFFGKNPSDQVEIHQETQTLNGIKFLLKVGKKFSTINLPIFGTHNSINFAASSAIALTLGLKMDQIQKRSALILPTEHRLEVKKMGHLTLIDNTYNTNPVVANSSLKLLKDLPGPEKIILTPGLIELGKESENLNKIFAKTMAQVADQIYIVGENAKQALRYGLAEVAFPPEKTHFVKSTQHGLEMILTSAKKDAVLLIENDLPDQYF